MTSSAAAPSPTDNDIATINTTTNSVRSYWKSSCSNSNSSDNENNLFTNALSSWSIVYLLVIIVGIVVRIALLAPNNYQTEAYDYLYVGRDNSFLVFRECYSRWIHGNFFANSDSYDRDSMCISSSANSAVLTLVSAILEILKSGIDSKQCDSYGNISHDAINGNFKTIVVVVNTITQLLIVYLLFQAISARNSATKTVNSSTDNSDDAHSGKSSAPVSLSVSKKDITSSQLYCTVGQSASVDLVMFCSYWLNPIIIYACMASPIVNAMHLLIVLLLVSIWKEREALVLIFTTLLVYFCPQFCCCIPLILKTQHRKLSIDEDQRNRNNPYSSQHLFQLCFLLVLLTATLLLVCHEHGSVLLLSGEVVSTYFSNFLSQLEKVLVKEAQPYTYKPAAGVLWYLEAQMMPEYYYYFRLLTFLQPWICAGAYCYFLEGRKSYLAVSATILAQLCLLFHPINSSKTLCTFCF